jgi:hypothetical protein
MFKVYVAHPYDGKEENKLSVEEKIVKLALENPDRLYISPIHTLGYLYSVLSYEEGMTLCFGLLGMCDILILCEGWEDSAGCRLEKEYALSNGIPTIYYKDGGYHRISGNHEFFSKKVRFIPRDQEIGMRIKLVESEVIKQYPRDIDLFDFDKEYVVDGYYKQGTVSIKIYDEELPNIYLLNKEQYIRVNKPK